ncbi:MAG: DNA-binding protein [Actinobacteria bacterium 13_2_20CM_2_72_6]|nr:MAG: DNA-binding protein [Actinobacteria bacterium 13_2_20CM_2_72_6]
MFDIAKRFLVGRKLGSDRLGETLLPKSLALPVFCSDPLSSVAYATQEILLVLSLGGLALLTMAWWVALAVVALLVIVVASYRQTCYAYPTGGGAYAVSRANLGSRAALVAASALLVDYVLTVAVSVAAGVDNIVSAFPVLAGSKVLINVGLIALLALINLRGVKESGTAFAIPTYGFVAVVLVLLGAGGLHMLTGHRVVAESAHYPIAAGGGGLVIALALRAFASGCTALTGVEAVSNGVPSFRPPKSRNAANTLAIMGVLAITMFAGITALAIASQVHVTNDNAQLLGFPAGGAQKTVIAQLGDAVFGGSSVGFYLLQAFTAAILVLAANTAFNGFPILASILGQDGYLPRQFARRGDRLVFSNGIVLLALLAAGLIWAFGASTTRLIQLYIIGVFVSFTLSQAGMVRHWNRRLAAVRDRAERHRIHRARAINLVGALVTALVLVIVLVTKFTHGAWLVVIAMPALYVLMTAIPRHYRHVAEELAPEPLGAVLPARIHAVVLVSRLHKPALRALAYARATRPDTLTALTVATTEEELRDLQTQWEERGIPVALTVLESKYRDITGPVLDFIAERRGMGPRDVVVVYLPEYVVGHWWEHLLHNQSALRLKARLLFQPGVMVTSVPWQLRSSAPPPAPAPAPAEAPVPTPVKAV